MQIYKAVPGEPLPLGRRYENNATRIVFDISAWADAFGPGTVRLLHQRPGDAAPYPVAIARTGADGNPDDDSGTLVLWDVTHTDIAQAAHYGRAELRYYSGAEGAEGFLVKSDIYKTVVENALGAAQADAPEEEREWLDALLEASQRLDGLDLDNLSGQVSAAIEAAQTARTAAEEARNVPASALPFASQRYVALDNSMKTLITANCNAKAGAVIGVQAQIAMPVETVVEGNAQTGWTALERAEVSARFRYDASVSSTIVRTLDSGDHILHLQRSFAVESDGNHTISLQMSVTGGFAEVSSGDAVMLLSGAKAATS